MGKIAKFGFFTAGSQPSECAVQQGISDFLTADEKTYTGSSVQTVDVPIELEFLGIMILLKWTSLYVTSSQLLLLLLHEAGLMGILKNFLPVARILQEFAIHDYKSLLQAENF